MTVGIVGRAKKPAKRQNYKIAYDLLARLKAVSVLEDRSDTAQLERWIREGSERWEIENPSQSQDFRKLVNDFLKSLEDVSEDDQ